MSSFRYPSMWIAFTVIAATTWLGSIVLGQEQEESVKIKPYAGPPIYLDEPEVVAAPKLVQRTMAPPENYPDGKPRIEREVAQYSDGHVEADGIFREYYPNGKLFVEGQFRKGRQEGEWAYYFDNGKINRKATFTNGQPDGTREVYRADGSLAAKRGFRDGLRHGEWITYDKTGKQPMREEHYENGKVDGVWKVWHPNGQLRQQVSFKQGQRDGTSIEWDEKGQKRAELNFVNNKLHGTASRWFPDGRKIVQEYREGRLESQTTE